MCGIAGIYNLRGCPVDLSDLHILNAQLLHRGPDGNDAWVEGSVGLSHTRLSIIDLSVHGKQPMSNEDETVWITYNGEIYNYEELRQQLVALGHQFKSNTDTEVIVHLYEEKGVRCLDYLRGMFAFAIWDAKKRELFLARDRMGKKPLYYTVQNDTVVFASELKAIKALPWTSFDFEPEVLSYVFSYDHVPWPKTMFSNVFKLPPSSYLILSENKIGRPVKYWKIDLQKKVSLSEDEASYQFTQLMTESIKMRLRSDVPLGMFLSGGIDSSFIVGIASQLLNEPISTFSIGYEDQDTKDPEYHFSREVATRFQTKHTEMVFDSNIISLIPQIMESYDEPFCIPNALAHYQLCRETRKSVVVALSGDGADEILGGYDVYKNLKTIDLLSILNPFRNSTSNNSHQGCIQNKFLLALYLLKTPRAFRRGFLKQIAFENRSKNMFSKSFRGNISDTYVGDILDEFYLDGDPEKFIDGVLYGDLFINYAWATTIATDIAGMSNSLEVRSPFLDHKLVEYAFSLPVNMKIGRNNQEKKILYKAAKGLLPDNIVKRKKMSYGVGIPYQRFFFNEWLPFVKEVVFDEKIQKMKLFDLTYISQLMDNEYQNTDSFKSLWKVFCVCIWLHQNN